jgi:hypothetical protein
MNLRRYNEILFAVVVTAAAVVFVVHLLRFGLHGHHEERAGVPGAPSPPSSSLAPAGSRTFAGAVSAIVRARKRLAVFPGRRRRRSAGCSGGKHTLDHKFE